jgi:hypothetical protein
MTAPARPIVFRPIIERLRSEGHEVQVTARDYAQTLGLLRRLGIPHQVIGRHGGASRVRKLVALVARTARMRDYGRHRQFDLAVAHGSNDLALAAAWLRIPAGGAPPPRVVDVALGGAGVVRHPDAALGELHQAALPRHDGFDECRRIRFVL